MIQLVQDLGRQLIHFNQVGLILLDFSKAFDKVNHLKYRDQPWFSVFKHSMDHEEGV